METRMENKKSSLLSGYWEQEEQCFRKHLPEAEKHDHSLVRTDIKEKYNITFKKS